MNSGLDIHEWVEGLLALDDSDRVAEVSRYVRANPVSRASLAPYAHFEPRRYTRNLIHRDERFEVLALCWEVSQASCVHNHGEQNCWVLMAEGELQSLNYRLLSKDPAGSCKLVGTGSDALTRANPATVDSDEPIHKIVNKSSEQRALSVHVYSLPIDSCEIYDLDAGTYREVGLSYWSVRGELCAQPSA